MKFIDLKTQYEIIKPEIDAAVKRVLESGGFILGEEVAGLEKEIAEFCGSAYGIAVNSGTDALFLSLKATGIGRGDEVITTPFTFFATAEVIANTGAQPVFADIIPGTFNIDPKEIEKKITKKTKAILPVHLFGQIADMDSVGIIAKEYGLKVIEDACQAIGADYKAKKAGSFGDCGCFSFFPTKNLGGYGDGGMVVVNDEQLADKIRLLSNHGSSTKDKYLNLTLGGNSRLDAMQAAILRVKLKYLKEWNKKRKENAEYYSKSLKGVGDIATPQVGENMGHIYHQYTIRTSQREGLCDFLKKSDIPTMIYYYLPLHLQPALEYLGYQKGDFPAAEKAASEVLSLPVYPELPRQDQDFVISKIKEFYT